MGVAVQLDLTRYFDAQDRFDPHAYLIDHPRVYLLFRKYAYELYSKGIRRYGAKAIVERIRYQEAMDTGRDGFKINNNIVSYLARKLADEEPLLFAEFFSFRGDK